MFLQMALSWAVASPGHFGPAHLGSAPVEAGDQWVGVGGGAFGVIAYGALVGGIVEAGGALGERGALHAMVGVNGLYEFGAGATFSGRHLLVEEDAIRLAVTGQLLVFGTPRDFDPFVQTRLSPGIALDTGSRRVRFDLAWPIWGIGSYNQYVGPARTLVPMAFTAGLNVIVGSEYRHRLRYGVIEGFSYGLTEEALYVDVGVGLLPVPNAWFKVGHRF